MKLAYAYLRTSSAANAGSDQDSHKRQLKAVEHFAAVAGFEIVLPAFHDAAVSGCDLIHDRSEFADLLVNLDDNLREITTQKR